jgi:hypothetical protein
MINTATMMSTTAASTMTAETRSDRYGLIVSVAARGSAATF